MSGCIALWSHKWQQQRHSLVATEAQGGKRDVLRREPPSEFVAVR